MIDRPRVYMDYAATTPLDPRVAAVMQPYFDKDFGNPSSIHIYGQRAEAALEDARQVVSSCLNCQPDEVIFTSGGTESDNLALRGAALAARKKSGATRILISPVEHHAVGHTARQLADEYGFVVDNLPVSSTGLVDADDVARQLDAKTAVVAVIYANNEIGSINPINEIGMVCREKGIPLLTDAVQAAAYLPMNVQIDKIDLMAIGAHKFYGPKGVGALYVRRGTAVMPVQTGGGQERGLRAGTQNVPYIVGLAEALRLAQSDMNANSEYCTAMRAHLIGQVLEQISEVRLSGDVDRRLPNHASFVFKGVDGNRLLAMLDARGFACSSGSACKTGSPEPSEVLTAIGFQRDWALGSLRITLGNSSKSEDIDGLMAVLPDLVEKARKW
jgi:cysteine desulfurase